MFNWLNPKPKPRHVVATATSRLAKFRHEVDGVVAQYLLHGLTATEAIERIAELTRAVDSHEASA